MLGEIGAQILVETARLWADLGFYGADQRFHIHGVTGPDEYTTVVNDNAYTNLMARMNLNFAAATVRRLRAERPEDYTALVHAVRLQFKEVESWERAAAAMYIPFDEKRGIHPQDETFLDRKAWDLNATPREKFPLLLHYHPLVIYRHQVLKQADIVLAMFLLGDEFSEEQKRRNFDYYDPLTTGDSSLSACVQSIIAAEIGRERQALEYFQYALLMDLGNVAGNASDGVHIAAAAGVWSSLVFGFGGVRDFDGRLSFTPRLPHAWNELAFSLRFCGRQIRVRLTHDEESYLIDEGDPLEVIIRGEPHLLSPGTAWPSSSRRRDMDVRLGVPASPQNSANRVKESWREQFPQARALAPGRSQASRPGRRGYPPPQPERSVGSGSVPSKPAPGQSEGADDRRRSRAWRHGQSGRNRTKVPQRCTKHPARATPPRQYRDGPNRTFSRAPGPPAGRAGDSAEMTLRLIEERDRIAEGMNNIVVRRLFSAALDLEAALGLVGEHHAAGKIQHAIDELDLAIRDLRDTLFDHRHHDPAARTG